jgi:methylamine--corrinoid protein Co-methyltransferase
LEARLGAEVGHAVARQGMTREQADEIVNRLLAKYESDIPDAPVGEPFQALYDVRKAVPKPEYLDRYSRIKEELGGMGVDFLF